MISYGHEEDILVIYIYSQTISQLQVSLVSILDNVAVNLI